MYRFFFVKYCVFLNFFPKIIISLFGALTGNDISRQSSCMACAVSYPIQLWKYFAMTNGSFWIGGPLTSTKSPSWGKSHKSPHTSRQFIKSAKIYLYCYACLGHWIWLIFQLKCQKKAFFLSWCLKNTIFIKNLNIPVNSSIFFCSVLASGSNDW